MTLRASGTLNALPVSGWASARLGLGRPTERLLGGWGAAQRRLGFPCSPGLVRHTAQRQAHVTHDPVGHVERGGNRDEREGVGRAVAHLAVARARGEGQGWQVHRRDQLAVREHRVPLWLVAGDAVDVDERERARPVLAQQQAHAMDQCGRWLITDRPVQAQALPGR